tara:strand:- start:639 stop:1616 length:978 start_codon:yes stop_codon:yes gene_type:complete
MATHDYNLANQSGSSFRADLNNALAAIVSQNSSPSEPSTTFAYQYWIDSDNSPRPLLKQRNTANNNWIDIREINGPTYIQPGNSATPGLAFDSDKDTGIQLADFDKIAIVTNATNRLVIDETGKVGINQNTPAESLDVVGNIKTTGNLDIASGNIVNGSPAIGTSGFDLQDDGVHKLGRNTADGNNALVVYGGSGEARVKGDGDLQNTNNNYGAISDSKLKENIVDAGSQWDDIKEVRVRNYNFKSSTGYGTHTQIGVIAQELEAVSPGLVKESNDEDADGNSLGTTTKTVSYSVLYMKAVKALQEAMDRIETLETKVAALEAGN